MTKERQSDSRAQLSAIESERCVHGYIHIHTPVLILRTSVDPPDPPIIHTYIHSHPLSLACRLLAHFVEQELARRKALGTFKGSLNAICSFLGYQVGFFHTKTYPPPIFKSITIHLSSTPTGPRLPPLQLRRRPRLRHGRGRRHARAQ